MRQAQWSVGENVDILTRPKAKVPGDWAIRYAAMVLVTLIIAYKYVKFLGFLIPRYKLQRIVTHLWIAT